MLVDILRPIAEWVLAIVGGLLPKPFWRRLDPPLPIFRTAGASGIATLMAGFAIGVDGFLDFTRAMADVHNAWMLKNVSAGCSGPDCAANAYRIAMVPYGVSAVTLFAYLFLTPLGLFSTYLAASGLLRAVSAFVGDPRADFLLSGAYWATTSLARSTRARRDRGAREKLEGPEVRDVLGTGEWAGLPVDYVVIASRLKPEWTSGAIILSSADWYRLGAPVDREVDGHLRTLYPLTRLEVTEVVRRGIEYELPRLSPRYARKRSPSHV
jgi:hypothetical protein